MEQELWPGNQRSVSIQPCCNSIVLPFSWMGLKDSLIITPVTMSFVQFTSILALELVKILSALFSGIKTYSISSDFLWENHFLFFSCCPLPVQILNFLSLSADIQLLLIPRLVHPLFPSQCHPFFWVFHCNCLLCYLAVQHVLLNIS